MTTHTPPDHPGGASPSQPIVTDQDVAIVKQRDGRQYVPDIEAAVEELYRTIEIPQHIVTALRELIIAELDRLHESSRRDRGTYLAERNDLNDRRKNLLHAHLEGAVPVDLLKDEQDKIARRMAFLDAQINAGDIEYDQATAHLDDCLTLAGDCYKLYMSIDDSLRRIANQAFFDKLYVQTNDQIDSRPGEPFNIFFDPDVQQLATTRQRAAETGNQTGNVVGLNNDQLVEHRGFEPLTSSMPWKRATNCANAPNLNASARAAT